MSATAAASGCASASARQNSKKQTAEAHIAPRKGAAPARKSGAGAKNPVAELQSRVKGFALDLKSGGPDKDDEHFKETA